jgi:hypothetical protein
MAIETLAATAVAILAPYLAEGAKSFATKTGGLLAEKIGGLYQAIKKKFTGDSDAEQTLDQVQAKPESKGRQQALQELLVEKMTSDSKFSELINALVAEIKAADSNNALNISGDRNVAIQGDASENIIVTGDRNRIRKS